MRRPVDAAAFIAAIMQTTSPLLALRLSTSRNQTTPGQKPKALTELRVAPMAHLMREVLIDRFLVHPADGLYWEVRGDVLYLRLTGKMHQWAAVNARRCEDEGSYPFDRINPNTSGIHATIHIAAVKCCTEKLLGLKPGKLYLGNRQIQCFFEHFTGNKRLCNRTRPFYDELRAEAEALKQR